MRRKAATRRRVIVLTLIGLGCIFAFATGQGRATDESGPAVVQGKYVKAPDANIKEVGYTQPIQIAAQGGPGGCGDGAISVPETCDPPGGAGCDCCVANGTPGCSSPLCTAAICAGDSFCCNTDWDSLCVTAALLDPICLACCTAECRDNCTSCGDGIVQDDREETCDPPGLTLYGAAHVGGPGSPSVLYRIDPATGTALTVGAIGFNRVGGIDFHPSSRVLYGIAERPADGVHVLITIDPATGLGAEVGPLLNTAPGGHFDISFRSDGTLFLTAFNPIGGVAVFTVNTGTGEATLLGDTGTGSPGNALGFNPADALYHADDVIGMVLGTLYTVDQGTGASGAVAALTYLGFPPLTDPRPNAMDFNPATGVGFTSVNDGSGGAGPNYLARLNPGTGDVLNIGPTVAGLDALAWQPAQTSSGNICRSDCTSCGDGIVNGTVELIVNGDFETGVLAPWIVDDLPGSGGTFIVSTPGAMTPLSGNPTSPNPGGGAFYAVTDMDFPGTHALSQPFTVPATATEVRLSFEMFVDDWSESGGIVDPAGLDHTVPSNQHARVDILAAGAPPFDTGAGVLANYYLGVDDPFLSLPHLYTSYSIDITADVTPGGTYRLRFAEVDNQGFNHQGVDNVSITAVIEECDDGNRVDGDGCNANCQIECGNGVIDPNETCDPPGGPGCDCCVPNGTPGCTSPACTDIVCAADTFCCNTDWDTICADAAVMEPVCLACCDATCRDNCTSCGDTIVQSERLETCDSVGGAGCDCCVDNGTPGCTSPVCTAAICAVDAFCCNVSWDSECATAAAAEPACLACCDATCRDNCTSCGDGVVQALRDEECELPGTSFPNSDCCVAHGTPGCEVGACEAEVCAIDTFCCDVEWDSICVDEATAVGCCPAQCLDCCVDIDGDGTCNAADSCPGTPNTAGGSDCCENNGTPGCTNPACEAEICGFDTFCCSSSWDNICAAEALENATCIASCGAVWFSEQILALDKVTFGWLTPQEVVVVRGNLADVPTDPYGFVSVGSSPGAVTEAPAIDAPSAGQTAYGLARPDCPLGSWWSGGDGQCGTTANGAFCPFGFEGNRTLFLP